MAIEATSNLSELSSFRADDTVVEVIPQFALPQPTHLLSSDKPVGPWQAGIPTKVPLWLAVHLQTKQLCTVPTPSWLSVSNLKEIVAFERKENILWNDESRLPFDYYQIAQRMPMEPAAKLLLKDLLQVRMDKLRQQFQELLKNQPSLDDEENLPPPTAIDISGMGSIEIALLQKTITQALKDQDKLRNTNLRKAKDIPESGAADPSASSQESTPGDRRPRRVNLRKFR
jgi:GINS complex subunit 2